MNLSPRTQLAVTLAKQAGALVKTAFYQHTFSQTEKSPGDPVTEADLASEALIKNGILEHFAEDSIIAEESGDDHLSKEYRWHVDPIDGTINFSRGIPQCGISIGITHGNDLFAGVIYDPVHDELYVSESSQGATRNDQPISVSLQEDPARALVWYTLTRHTEPLFYTRFIDGFTALHHNGIRFRATGSAALQLAYTACGRLDASIIPFPFASWDVIAGLCLIQEAGGVITDWQGNPWTPETQRSIASCSSLHPHLVSLLHTIE